MYHVIRCSNNNFFVRGPYKFKYLPVTMIYNQVTDKLRVCKKKVREVLSPKPNQNIEETIPVKLLFGSSRYLDRLARYKDSKFPWGSSGFFPGNPSRNSISFGVEIDQCKSEQHEQR